MRALSLFCAVMMVAAVLAAAPIDELIERHLEAKGGAAAWSAVSAMEGMSMVHSMGFR